MRWFAWPVLASAGSFSYRRQRGTASYGYITVCGPRLFRHLDDTLLLALGHAAPLGLGFLQVGLLATHMHVSDPEQLPVRLVHLLLYEAAQFLDEFGKMSSQTLALTLVRVHRLDL